LSVLFLQHRAASIENQADSYTGRANNGLLQVFALCSEQVEIVGATYGQECRVLSLKAPSKKAILAPY